MGERVEDRAGLIAALASLPKHPESVPVNALVRVAGTPLGRNGADRRAGFRPRHCGGQNYDAGIGGAALGGAEGMGDEAQALCFVAGANSIFYGSGC